MSEYGTMDYYAYEYSILMRLNDIFLIKNTSITSESLELKDKEKIMAIYASKDQINLNFDNGFSFIIGRDNLKTSFHNSMKIEDVVTGLESKIKEQYIEKIMR